jgi:hypothetical protein
MLFSERMEASSILKLRGRSWLCAIFVG